MNKAAEVNLTLITIIQLVLVATIVYILYGWAGAEDAKMDFMQQAHSKNAMLLAETLQIRTDGTATAPMQFESSQYKTALTDSAIGVTIGEQPILQTLFVSRTTLQPSEILSASILLTRSQNQLVLQESLFGTCPQLTEELDIETALAVAETQTLQSLVSRAIGDGFYTLNSALKTELSSRPYTPSQDFFVELRIAEDTNTITLITGAGILNDRLICIANNNFLSLTQTNQRRSQQETTGLILIVPETIESIKEGKQLQVLEQTIEDTLREFTEVQQYG